MKLLLIEGPDRVGKNTIINGLVSSHSNIVIRHFSSPKGESSLDKQKFQMDSFNKEFFLYRNNSFSLNDDNSIWIWNRSHIGEWVYSYMYRGLQAEWIFSLEKQYGFDYDKNIFLLNLYAEPEFLIRKDDGKSFSTKIEDKKQELFLFKDAFEMSKIPNKLSLKIDDDGNYVNSSVILNNIKKFLENE